MNLCSYNHEEVCYEGRNCPVCEVIAEKKEVEKELAQEQQLTNKLQEEIEKLEDAANGG